MEYPHEPVLLDEVVRFLVHDPGGVYVDGTVGSAGHSEAIRKRLAPEGRLICLDRDPEALRISEARLAPLGRQVTLVRAGFAELGRVLHEAGIAAVDGILLDLGMSSYQLEHSGRGFSFQRDEPLDMRMDPLGSLKAGDIVNSYSLTDIEDILRRYGEEKRARSIAKAIVRTRKIKPILSSHQLAEMVRSIVPPSHGHSNRHPATRTFQALRIAVNQEMQQLDRFLQEVPWLLAGGGRLVILAYHSLEDRRVKQAMTDWEQVCTCPPGIPVCVCGRTPLFKRLFRKPVRPTEAEIAGNPRARSAILRVAERIAT